MRSARELLKSYPFGGELPPNRSDNTFADGGHYGIEVSSVNNYKLLQSVLSIAKEKELNIHRIDQCRGIFRLVDAEKKWAPEADFNLCTDVGRFDFIQRLDDSFRF